MPNFKPKSSKTLKVCERKATTIDGKHRSILDNIAKAEEEELPRLRRERKRLVKLRKTTRSIEKVLDYNDKISIINRRIKESKNARIEYWKDNSLTIFDYYEARTTEGCTSQKPVVLDSFFGKVVSKDHAEDGVLGLSNVRKYLSKQDESFLSVEDYVVRTDLCKTCNEGELIPVDHEGVLICNKCAAGTSVLIENDRPSYKEPPKEVSFYAYKRINHFREIIAQFQAKETTQIPESVLSDIKNQIKKERITADHLTNRRAKELLKKLGYNKYYEHIPFIKDKLGIKPPVMSPALEDRLCNLFMEIQAPYARYCPSDRVNFLNYYYTVYKLCELLDHTEFLPYFPMLKDREKRIEQDDIWRKICKELNWEFVPTV
tara:strand:+ start:3201 stop:4325 length:1125 start_codon:yes stop_codon:yes gene_type:complete